MDICTAITYGIRLHNNRGNSATIGGGIMTSSLIVWEIGA